MTGKILEFSSEKIIAENRKLNSFYIKLIKANSKPKSKIELKIRRKNPKRISSIPEEKNNIKIIGIFLIIILGLIASFVGLTNIIHLIDISNNKIIKVLFEMQSIKMEIIWIKYIIISLLGITLILFGLKQFMDKENN